MKKISLYETAYKLYCYGKHIAQFYLYLDGRIYPPELQMIAFDNRDPIPICRIEAKNARFSYGTMTRNCSRNYNMYVEEFIADPSMCIFKLNSNVIAIRVLDISSFITHDGAYNE